MTAFTRIDLRCDVEDRAPADVTDGIEARFATGALRTEASGLSLRRIAPGVRRSFAHRHASCGEVHVVESGGRVTLDDEIIDLGLWDAVRVPGPVRSGAASRPARTG